MTKILILYYSRNGTTKKMAYQIALGVESLEGVDAVIRTVPEISSVCEQTENVMPEKGAPFATLDDLKSCHGLALGSPTHFGNMAGALKHFIDQTTELWFAATLSGKPAAVFTSSSAMHSGHESTLLSMMLPLIHHGMLIVSVPCNEIALKETNTGGTPYGPSHLSTAHDLSSDEKSICWALGHRLAQTSVALKNIS
ncbi:MAG: NAD(P)H:quinone oxidoreductase [Methylococcales symbiont of Iophon sp. n. MRB-2018]|nr:MAG: NAD(P)H:quinone oxidoreductase [Methylococcales symbiont of Iophon sp. n. MRB-2018]KAF3979900.1 MAG: NAD(P)H:quinone oxidoreductase [Methylococcales symbiont of Iophon sp. n. MRB-2018]